MPPQATKNAVDTRQEFSSHQDEWQHYAAQGADRMQEIVQDNAGKSMLIALVSGLGVGILIGTAIGGSRHSSRWWDRSTAEGLGQRILEKFEGIVPAAISERIHR